MRPPTCPTPGCDRWVDLVRRVPVTAEPQTAVAEAASLMAAERVSSLLVPMRDGWGIVTDRDLRAKVVATKADPDTPARDVRDLPGAHDRP